MAIDSTHGPGQQPGGDDTAQQLARCRAELASVEREFEQFAYGVSHDLRAPLRTIESFGTLLRRELGEDAPPKVQDHLERVLAASARLGGLLDGLLDLSRAGRQQLKPQPVDLGLLAEWAAAELQEAEPERDVQWVIQRDVQVHGDEALLRQLLQRMLHNAWKFTADTPPPTRIALQAERQGDRMHVHLSDTGSGFDMRYAEKLFVPFQRLHGPDEGGGHGMGLAIARRIVERHGGSLRAESTPGQGSTFHLELPAEANA